MKKEEINYLNDEHKLIIERYLIDIKKIMYYSTEFTESGKYQEFINIMSSVYSYSNNFYKSMLKKENNGALNEFMFLIPNMMFYTSIGYLTALKDENNYSILGDYLEDIATLTEEATSELADILIDNREKQEIIREIFNSHITKN